MIQFDHMLDDWEDHQKTALLLWVLGITVMGVLVTVVTLLLKTRNKLNW